MLTKALVLTDGETYTSACSQKIRVGLCIAVSLISLYYLFVGVVGCDNPPDGD